MLLVVVVVGVRSLPFDIFGNVGYAKKVLRFDNILYLAHKALAAAIAPKWVKPDSKDLEKVCVLF